MKKCPFCAEEIQDAAIKCKHCGEFLNAKEQTFDAILASRSKSRDLSAKKGPKWLYQPYVVILAFLGVGPFALPLLWMNPNLSKTVKIIGTIVMLVLTYYLTVAFVHSMKLLMEYYSQYSGMMGGG